jgi:hypothetical protein
MGISSKHDMRNAMIAGMFITALATAFGLMIGKFSFLVFPGLLVAMLVGGGLDYINPFALWIVFPIVNCIFYAGLAYLTILLIRIVSKKKASGDEGHHA